MTKKPNLKKSKITALVTGGAGFIGSHLVDALLKKGWRVKVIDNLSTGKKENLNPAAKFHLLDIRDLEKIRPIFKRVDYVFHLAALPHVEKSIQDPLGANQVNLGGTLNVLVASKDAAIKKLVYASSCSVYGNQEKTPSREDMGPHPISPYALQKYASELYCRLFSEIYGLKTVSLRCFNIYGPRQPLGGAYCSVIGIFLGQRLAGKPMTIVGDGSQRRDFISVFDVVMANILAAQNKKIGQGEAINIGAGRNWSVGELAKMIGGPTVKIPPRVEIKKSLADNGLAKKVLGWRPEVKLSKWLEEYKKEIRLK